MNIIVSNDKSIRLTQYSSQSTYNLTNINFYVSKELTVDSLQVNLEQNRNVYPFYLLKAQEAANYNIYTVAFTQDVSLSARTYTIVLVLNDERLTVGDIDLTAIEYRAPRMMKFGARANASIASIMTDEHEPIDIDDRDIKISNNQNILVAEDNVSQCITFRMAKTYDGIDLTAEDKAIYIDFIDSEDASLYNILIDKENITTDEVDPSLILIKWVVPYAITKKAGSVSFAISVIGSSEDEYYIWQTKPSQLIIQPNLHKRNDTPNESNDDLNVLGELQAQVNTLNDEVTAIKESDVYNLDANSTDSEVIIGGGGAPV